MEDKRTQTLRLVTYKIGQRKTFKDKLISRTGSKLAVVFSKRAGLTEGTHFRAPDCTVIMRQAREILLMLAPLNFSISLSTCCTYTQNYKGNTFQAKRHHSNQPEVNADVSLK